MADHDSSASSDSRTTLSPSPEGAERSVESVRPRRRTLPAPDWSAPRSVSALALEWLSRHAPIARRPGARAELASLRAKLRAATRARDLIVVPAIGDGEHDGWLAKLNPVVYPASANRRAPITRHPMGCPEFGDDSVLTRPNRAPDKMKSVAPGLYRAKSGDQSGEHEIEIVWWDPLRLILQVEEAMGLRQNKLLQADEKKLISLRGMKMHEVWTAKRAEMLAAGIAPAITIATATELALERPAQAVRSGHATSCRPAPSGG